MPRLSAKSLRIALRTPLGRGIVLTGLALILGGGLWLTQQTTTSYSTQQTQDVLAESTTQQVAPITSGEETQSEGSTTTTNTVPTTTARTTAQGADNQPTATTTNPTNSTNTTSPKQTATDPCSQVRTGSQPANSLTVSLIINDCAAKTVTLPSGANQCDVLNQAVAQGVLQSVDMHLDPGLNKPGVFLINGQGDSKSVWWVYYVNGKSPPKGCSEITAEQGDTIKWKYLK